MGAAESASIPRMSGARLVGTIAAAIVVIVMPSRSRPHRTAILGFYRDGPGIALNAAKQIATRGLLTAFIAGPAARTSKCPRSACLSRGS